MDSSPREVEKPIAAPAVDRWSPEVELTVGASDDVDIELPPGRGGVAGHQVERLLPDLHSDMDSVERGAVRIAESWAREVDPLDDNPHLLILA